MWVFGYGSLIWRPGFAWSQQRDGVLRGYKRRFWQGSTDHRGVPGAPGRVVTLLPDPQGQVWGRAWQLTQDQQEATLALLDHREKGGYGRQTHTIHTAWGEQLEALVYIGGDQNPNYLGPAPLEEMARQILAASGPSGHNLDYLLKLAQSLRQMQATDEHVFALEAAALRLQRAQKPQV